MNNKKSGSVAPKERVNIVYRPAVSDEGEDVELPLKMLVVGDFTNQQDDRSVEDRAPVNINKDNFDNALKAQNVHLDMKLPNYLNGNPEDGMTVNLKFESMNDFKPDNIIKQMPEMDDLLKLREALKALKGPLNNIPEFRKKIQNVMQDKNSQALLLEELSSFSSIEKSSDTPKSE